MGGEKKDWYLLFVHARNYLLLNTCSDKVGGEHVTLIHVIDSVTYNFNSQYVQ